MTLFRTSSSRAYPDDSVLQFTQSKYLEMMTVPFFRCSTFCTFLFGLAITFVMQTRADEPNAPVAKAAADSQRLDIWDGNASLSDGGSERASVWITVHRPVENANGIAIVICPGGGYGGLVVGAEGHGIATWLNSHGITGVVLEYRLPAGRHAVPLLDAQRAIRTVRANARKWELDPEQIGIMGFSAGGHLASTAATHFASGDPTATDAVERVGCRPDFAILIYPVVTMGSGTHGGSKSNLLGKDPSPELVEYYCNEKQVSSETPPMFLAHAIDDHVVPAANSRNMFAALQRNAVVSEYLELPSGGHGLNGYRGPMWEAWQTRSLGWLADLLQ
jgi:acetyl esterase/lipase